MTYAFTPETLGELWEVSPATVRNLVRAGSLRAFRVGPAFPRPFCGIG